MRKFKVDIIAKDGGYFTATFEAVDMNDAKRRVETLYPNQKWNFLVEVRN